jgi:hypothetical protein
MPLGMLLAYDADGNVCATLDYVVRYADDGTPLGLVDFAAHEDAGGEMTDVWNVSDAKGSKVWPEWLGGAAHDFTVELDGPPGRRRIATLVHKVSGMRRERTQIEARIAERIVAAAGEPADIRNLVGGPDRPLQLDDEGKTKERVANARPVLPLVSAAGQTISAQRGDPT